KAGAYLLSPGAAPGSPPSPLPVDDLLKRLKGRDRAAPSLVILDCAVPAGDRALGVFGNGFFGELEQLVKDGPGLGVLTARGGGRGGGGGGAGGGGRGGGGWGGAARSSPASSPRRSAPAGSAPGSGSAPTRCTRTSSPGSPAGCATTTTAPSRPRCSSAAPTC